MTSARDSYAGSVVQAIPVKRIRPEEGLSRQRDRRGHQELCRSVGAFGVLTPITVRRAADGTGDYLLVKGQGRTLACRVLGIPEIPAVVVDEAFTDSNKVQQFLVENVARLRMKPVDRALLIAKARQAGEETRSVAERFGVSASTVRRLESQLNGASANEVAALRRGDVSLALHAIIARWINPEERSAALEAVSGSGLSASDLLSLLKALGWRELRAIKSPHASSSRQWLFKWACETLANQAGSTFEERLCRAVLTLPLSVPSAQRASLAG